MLEATVKWGKEKGIVLKPHKFKNGKFKSCEYKGGAERWAGTEEELKTFLRHGWSIRMSNRSSDNHRAPSLIVPNSISGWR
jgi:hypothetical protein